MSHGLLDFRPDHVTTRVGVVAVAAAVFTYLATWALLVLDCLVGAAVGFDHPAPSPSSWTLHAVYLAVAILGGLLTFLACRKRDLSLRQATVPAGLALAALLVVSGSMHAVGVWREHTYVRYLPPGVSRDAGLTYGHRACDWLAAQRWGRPPGHLTHLDGRSRTLVYQPRDVRWPWATSTETLTARYIDHLDAQRPGPLTRNERQQASVTGSAWFELCPFQQWVHRSMGDGGHRGEGSD